MGEPWIKFRHSLSRNPQIVRVACDLKMAPAAAAGCVATVWAWAARYGTNGFIANPDVRIFDEVVGVKRLGKTMLAAALVVEVNGGIELPDLKERIGGGTSERTSVYFILGGDCVKIGTATNPPVRLAQLQTGCPITLTLMGSIPGTQHEEFTLHERFAEFRVRPGGEWFRATAELLHAIRSLDGFKGAS